MRLAVGAPRWGHLLKTQISAPSPPETESWALGPGQGLGRFRKLVTVTEQHTGEDIEGDDIFGS